jgi:carbamoyltransferase
MAKPIYVLGTGTSHDGSSCLLKDGRICAAVEKERITRIKHDGGDDTESIKYCLEKENICLDDIDLIVQHSTLAQFGPDRLIDRKLRAQIITIPHHLAHAYSAYGASNFDECAVFVLDGAGSHLSCCTDQVGEFILYSTPTPNGNEDDYKENNSYYHFEGGKWRLICKEASRMWHRISDRKVKTFTENSIGNFYEMACSYCFRSFLDAGKVMGLAPYGNPSTYNDEAFVVKDGAMLLNQGILEKFNNKAISQAHFSENFQYYADIANWAQRELERAIIFLLNSRYEMCPSENLAYCGGVALNAVMNSKILELSPFKRLYVTPAAGDDGAALGCAYYGWLEVMKMERIFQESTTCFGKVYTNRSVKRALHDYHDTDAGEFESDNYFEYIYYEGEGYIEEAARLLSVGKILGWFQDESEFGPRALGRRSILADPRIKGVRDFINAEIKHREDFRPFAPAVLREDLLTYFEKDIESPYMLMVNQIKSNWKEEIKEIVHVDGSCRTQTVTPDWNPKFYRLLREFRRITGLSVLLNTSFNGVSMPIVETPADAFQFFYSGKLDYLVIQDIIVSK